MLGVTATLFFLAILTLLITTIIDWLGLRDELSRTVKGWLREWRKEDEDNKNRDPERP